MIHRYELRSGGAQGGIRGHWLQLRVPILPVCVGAVSELGSGAALVTQGLVTERTSALAYFRRSVPGVATTLLSALPAPPVACPA